MKRVTLSLLTLAAALSAGFFLTGCEQVKPYLETVKNALDRETDEEAAARKPLAESEIPPPPAPVKMEPAINKEARVSVLGYHDFTDGSSTNDMILNIEDFREQMQAIKEAQLPVISMRQFLDWKQAKADIPAECVLITIDDGWKATRTLAMDVLKEFGYPYTVFLYKNYIGVGGRSLTHEEIRELAANGATLASHSLSHQNMSRRGGRTDDDYDAWLRLELEESHRFLEETFGDTGAILKVFAFPYGIYSNRALELAREFGYEACFTVNGKKTTWDADDMEIGRYVIHGTTLANFDPALDFGGSSVTSAGRRLLADSTTESGEEQPPLVTVRPPANSVLGNRLPLIEVDLSRLNGVDPASLILRVTGFGRVPHRFDAATGLVSYQIPQRLRLESCGVQLTFRHAGSTDPEVIGWTFQIKQIADYLSSDATAPGENAPLPPEIDGTDNNSTTAAPDSRAADATPSI